MGIDHGSRTGWAILDDDKLVAWGYKHVLANNPPNASQEKLACMYKTVAELIACFKPDMIALEEPKDRTNGRTTQTLISYYAVAMLCAYDNNIRTNEVNPKQMKKVITGNGNADKELMLKWIAAQFNKTIDDISPVELYKVGAKKGQIRQRYYDESDACALAYFTWLKCRKEKYNE